MSESGSVGKCMSGNESLVCRVGKHACCREQAVGKAGNVFAGRPLSVEVASYMWTGSPVRRHNAIVDGHSLMLFFIVVGRAHELFSTSTGKTCGNH